MCVLQEGKKLLYANHQLLTRVFVLVQELHLQSLSSALGQKIWGGDRRIPSGAQNICPTEHEHHGLQHVRLNYRCTQCLDT